MTINYIYFGELYNSEEDAQNRAAEVKAMLDNNPTNWVVVKEVIAQDDMTYQVLPTKLTDDQINNIDNTKTYSIYSKSTGDNIMPLTGSEVTAKVLEYRNAYAISRNVDTIVRGDETVDPVEVTEINTTTDFSGYV
jgi:archaellum component FlaG (FlaF/FlaG flagellin family)